MSNGDLWEIPGGHRAIEVDGSTPDRLALRIIQPGEWLQGRQIVARNLCTRLPMRYYRQADPPKPV